MSKVAVLGKDHLAQTVTAGFAMRGFEVVGEHETLEASYVVVAHDTPVGPDGESDLTPIDQAVQTIAHNMRVYAPLIIMSQVRVGTCERLEQMVRAIAPEWCSGVVYIPENLKLTDGAPRFLEPDMLVFGSDHAHALRSAFKLFDAWTCPKLTMSLRSAEMVKHAINGWLAMNITYANALAALCRSVGADEIAVNNAIRMDRRMRLAPMTLGPSYPKQGTLGRDVYTLQRLCEEFGMEPCVK